MHPHSRLVTGPAWRAALLTAVVAVGLVSCSPSSGSGAGTADSECVAAFRNAEPRAGAPYQAGPLDDAIRTCSSLADWTDAWDRVPSAHPPTAEAVAYLRQRCEAASADLGPTPLCREASQSS